MAALAVVLAGKGVSALEEAGLLDIRPIVGVPCIELLDLYPTWHGVLIQVFTVIVLFAAFRLYDHRSSAAPRRP